MFSGLLIIMCLGVDRLQTSKEWGLELKVEN